MTQAPAWQSVTKRYTDAYLVARVVVGLGGAVKVVGFLVGGLLALLSFGVVKTLGTAFGAAGVVFGICAGAVIYILGVLISAAGQLQYATLDVAVNTSPILPIEEKTKLITASASQAEVSGSAAAYADGAGI